MNLTIDEIADNVVTQIMMLDPHSRDDIAYLKSLSREDMSKLHHSLGTAVRNDYGLWDKNNILTKEWHDLRAAGNEEGIRNGIDFHDKHPDAVSMKILHSIWEKVQEL